MRRLQKGICYSYTTGVARLCANHSRSDATASTSSWDHEHTHESAPAYATPEGVSEGAFNALSEEVLNQLAEKLDHAFDQLTHADADVSLEAGVLEVTLPQAFGNGTYVANRQTPNREIWLSSPISGPWRFKLHLQSMQWVYHRSGDVLHRVLEHELSSRLPLHFHPGHPPECFPGTA